jgi:hypothetical protein
LVLIGLLRMQGFDYIGSALALQAPFRPPEPEYEDASSAADERLRKDTPDHADLGDEMHPKARRPSLRLKRRLQSEITTTRELLADLEQRGIHPFEILQAVAPAPEAVQQAAARALSSGGKRAAASALAKFRRATKKLSLSTHTPVRRIPILRLTNLLLGKGFSETSTFRIVAQVLSTTYPERFGGLTADTVRQLWRRAQRSRAPDV